MDIKEKLLNEDEISNYIKELELNISNYLSNTDNYEYINKSKKLLNILKTKIYKTKNKDQLNSFNKYVTIVNKMKKKKYFQNSDEFTFSNPDIKEKNNEKLKYHDKEITFEMEKEVEFNHKTIVNIHKKAETINHITRQINYNIDLNGSKTDSILKKLNNTSKNSSKSLNEVNILKKRYEYNNTNLIYFIIFLIFMIILLIYKI